MYQAKGQYRHYVREISKRSFILRLGLPSTLICHENGAFQKRSSNQRNLKTPTFRFCVDGKRFEKGTFRKRRRPNNRVILPAEFS